MNHVRARRSIARRGTALVAAVFVALSALVGFAPSAAAHTPHDEIHDIAPSVEFQTDATVFAISRSLLLRSTDRGDTWARLANGLDNRFALSSVTTTIADPSVLYVSSRGDGVYRTTDAGNTWSNVSETLERRSVLLVEASPHDAAVAIALGSGEEGVASITRDAGETWTTIPDIVVPTAAVFADGASGFIAIGDRAGTLHVSADGGETWRATDLDRRRTGAVQSIHPGLAFPADPTIYVGTELGGVLRSTDGGATFTGGAELDLRGVGLTDLMIMDVTVAATADGTERVWASTRNDGVFVSDDGGDSWTGVLEGLTKDEMADRIGSPNFDEIEVAIAPPGTEPTVFLATFDGLFRTNSISEPWEYLITQVSTNIAGFALSPTFSDDQTIAVATYINGALISTDGGDSFAPINDGLAFVFEWTRRPDYVARLSGIEFYPDFAVSRKMFVGARGYYFETTDAGRLWQPYQPAGILVEDEFPADYFVPAFSPDFADDEKAFLGTDGGKFFKYSGDVEGIELINNVAVEIFTVNISPDFRDDETIVLGTQNGVLVSRDGGTNFEAPVRDVPRKITALGMSGDFAADGTAWAGSPAGLWVTRDGGQRFELVADAPFSTLATVEGIAVSPDYTNDGTVLVSIKGKGLFRSTDRGESFEAIAPQLLEQQAVFGSYYLPTSEPLRLAPQYAQDRTIFGIAEDHLYRSTDAGESWTTLDIPVTLHDPTADASRPLLASARYGGDVVFVPKAPPSDAFDTPIGKLSLKRVGVSLFAGVGAFLVLTLPLPGRGKNPTLVPNRVAGAVIGVVIVAAALLLLAA